MKVRLGLIFVLEVRVVLLLKENTKGLEAEVMMADGMRARKSTLLLRSILSRGGIEEGGESASGGREKGGRDQRAFIAK